MGPQQKGGSRKDEGQQLFQSLETRHHREEEGGLRQAQLEGSDFGLERVLGDGQDTNDCVVLRIRELVSSSYFQGDIWRNSVRTIMKRTSTRKMLLNKTTQNRRHLVVIRLVCSN